MSDGSTSAVSVNYSETGGTITAGGLYTAGSTAGTFRVIAVRQGDTKADTVERDDHGAGADPDGGGSDADERRRWRRGPRSSSRRWGG